MTSLGHAAQIAVGGRWQGVAHDIESQLMGSRRRRARSAVGSIAPVLMALVMLFNPFGWRDALIDRAVARVTERVEHRTQTILGHLGTPQEGQIEHVTTP